MCDKVRFLARLSLSNAALIFEGHWNRVTAGLALSNRAASDANCMEKSVG
jgi:hypothetical protein